MRNIVIATALFAIAGMAVITYLYGFGWITFAAYVAFGSLGFICGAAANYNESNKKMAQAKELAKKNRVNS